MQKVVDNKSSNSSQANARLSTKVMGSMEMYSGPIPPATELARYESTLPGAADRILSMAEKQSQHRQKMEDAMLQASIKSERNGQIFGFVIFSATIVVGFFLLLLGQNVEGLVSLVLAIGSIVGLFVYNREGSRKELRRKEQQAQKK